MDYYRYYSACCRSIYHYVVYAMTDRAFDSCVHVLCWIARKTGLTYKQVNVWLFCVIWPISTVGLIVAYLLK